MLSKTAETTMSLDDRDAAEMSDAAYLGAFGLYLNPFSKVPDDRFYYESPPLKQRMQTLSHMVANNDALIVVAGDEGGGKTSFLRHYANICEDQYNGLWQPHEVTLDGDTDSVMVLRAIAASLQTKVKRDESEQIEIIFQQLKKLNNKDCYPAVLIDDGHRLSPRALSAMQKLKCAVKDKGLKLSIVLFANRDIKNKFNDPCLRDVSEEWLYSIYLPRLSQKDTEGYLNHRLTVAGMFIDRPFKPADVATIYKLAKGLPRKTSLYAHRLLLQKFGSKEPSSKTRAEPGHLDVIKQKLSSMSRDNKIYMSLAVALLVVVFSVGPGRDNAIVDDSTVALQSDVAAGDKITGGNKNSNNANNSINDSANAAAAEAGAVAQDDVSRDVLPLDEASAALSDVPSPMQASSKVYQDDCKDMADLFVDCGSPELKPGQSIKKNISYK